MIGLPMKTGTMLFLYVFILGYPLSRAMAVEDLPKKYLIFGGNGMLGSATIERLLPGLQDEDTLVLVNRGNWYWDTAYTVRPYVTHIKCDRFTKFENCPDLVKFVTTAPYINAVVDFSAYYPSFIRQALDLLQGKVKLYIYISTDSVYEVCNKTHGEFTKEEDAVRPKSEEEQEELNNYDGYGNLKLAAEEVLQEYRQDKNGPPYIVLRLPDVIGPRDNTYRFWIYQLWMKLEPYLQKPVSIPSSVANQKVSFVFSNDVADSIVEILGNESMLERVVDQAFNLAMTETPTLLDMLNGMKEELNLTNVKILHDDIAEAPRLFPSVRRGPVNISKAESVLNWKPTSWENILKQTLQFYENAIKDTHLSEAKTKIIQTMQKHFSSDPSNVINGLEKVYGLSFARRRDEL